MSKKIFAIAVSALIALAALAGCKKDPVVAKVGDASIYNSQFREVFDTYAEYFGIEDPSDEASADTVAFLRDLVLETLVDDEVQMQKAKSLGLDSLDEQMKANVETDVEATLNSLIDHFKDQALGEDSTLSGEALDAKARELMNAYMAEAGFDEARIRADFTREYILNRLYEQSTGDITVSEETLLETYNARIEEVRELYEEDAATFETDYMEGAALYYIPEGFRRVKHILIALPDETINQLVTLRDAGEDAAANALRDASLKSIRAQADGILAQAAADGSNFDDLVTAHSDDTASVGMTNGYAVSKGGQFTREFINASFAIKTPMTLSGLVAGDYGYHIILYIETLTPGSVPFAELREEMEAELLYTAKQDAYALLCEQWRNEMNVQMLPENIVYAASK